MTGEEIAGIVRTVLGVVLGIVVGKGYIDNTTAASLAGAGGTIAIAVWSVVSKRKATQPVG